jgi:hypothetical protein
MAVKKCVVEQGSPGIHVASVSERSRPEYFTMPSVIGTMTPTEPFEPDGTWVIPR